MQDFEESETAASGPQNCVIDAVVCDVVPQIALPFRLLIVGPQGCGKSTLADGLGREMRLQVAETSAVLMEYAAPIVATCTENTEEESLKMLRTKSPYARRCLVAIGDTITAVKPDFLIATAAMRGGIIVGARRKIEVERWFSWERNQADFLIELLHEIGSDDTYELRDYRADARRYVQVVPASLKYFDSFVRELASDILTRAGL